MRNRSVTIEEIDELYLRWNRHINASALFRRALREEMTDSGVDPKEFRDTLSRAKSRGLTFDELVERTDRYEELCELAGRSPDA